MKERAFNARPNEVRAMLDGSLTQFRRLVRPQPNQVMPSGEPYWYIGGYRACPYRPESRHGATGKILRCPYGQPGGRLFVREVWMDLAGTGVEATSGSASRYAYGADTPPGSYGDECRKDYGFVWRSPVTMPRQASRITLEVVSVRVGRLQDISEADAKAEGIDPWTNAIGGTVADRLTGYRLGFRRSWERYHGQYSWDANHWVWVAEVKRVEGGAS